MNAQQVELLRNCILQCVHATGSFGAPFGTIHQSALIAGFRTTDVNALESHIHYLQSAGLIQPLTKSHTAAARRWTITSTGTDHLEVQDLV